MIHILLTDLETGSKEKDAAVFTFASLLFKLNDPQSITDAENAFTNNEPFENLLYNRLHVGDQWLDGRRLDDDTQAWWRQDRLNKPREAQKGGSGSFRDTLKAYVKLVEKLIQLHKAEYGDDARIVLYFRDRQFDDNIIQHAAEMYGIKLPYVFNQRRDVRTYIDTKLDTTLGYIPDYKPFPELPRHHAMTDVLRDAASMCEANRRSKINHTQ